MPPSQYKDALIAVAKLYYYGNMKQSSIAELTGLSRPKVSRMLQDARNKKIVQINIVTPESHYQNLEKKLCEELGLLKAVIVPTELTPEKTKRSVCRAAAEQFSQVVRDGARVGITWGTTTSGIIEYIPRRKWSGVGVYQLCAGVSAHQLFLDGHETTKQLAEALSGKPHVLNAPFVVNGKLMKQLLLEEPEIRNHFSMLEALDVAVVGLGSSDPAQSITYLADYISLEESRELTESGCAADVCGYRLRENGELADIPLNDRIISIEPETLKKLPLVLAVASGEEKALSILAAARGGYINSIVADEIAAIAVLKKLGV
ncbi:MAG: hypothetical protein LBR44_02150 [Clostridiales Family XIII bacterium]|jgi:DNA-binding transcriptional regulator LsrR (DeoR family)|nr:hypothetical protein [Clostridiales Family XIII bacterium]